MASKLFGEATGIWISARQCEKVTERISGQLEAERDEQTERFGTPEMPESSLHPVAVSVDDGKVRTRQEEAGPGVHGKEWKNHKAGLLMTVDREHHESDPEPEPPKSLTNRRRVEKLVAELGRSHGEGEAARREEASSGTEETEKVPVARSSPKIIARSCISTHTKPKQFGRMVAAEAWRRGFFGAAYAVFLGDGNPGNWTIQEEYFPGWIPILDFIHLVEHLVEAARAARGKERWSFYEELLRAAWKGESVRVRERLEEEARRLGEVPEGADKNDPRRVLARNIEYLRANRERMDYGRVRKLGLPITTSHIESLIGVIDLRVKAANKLWCGRHVERVLQVRAAYLSTTARWENFWATCGRKSLGRVRHSARAA